MSASTATRVDGSEIWPAEAADVCTHCLIHLSIGMSIEASDLGPTDVISKSACLARSQAGIDSMTSLLHSFVG